MDATTKLVILRKHIELKNESLKAAQAMYAEGELNEFEYKMLVRDIIADFVNKKQLLLVQTNEDADGEIRVPYC